MAARAHLSIVVVVVLWATSFSVIKTLLDHGVAAIDIALLRYAIAAPGFAFVLWRAGGLPGLTRRDAARVAAAGLLVVVGYHVFLNVGTRHTTSGIAALVVALSPALTLVFALALGLDRVRARHVLGLAVAFAGVAIVIALGTGETLSLDGAKGPLIVLGAPLAFALYNVILKPLLGRHDLLALTAATSLIGMVGLVPFVRGSTVDAVADGTGDGRAAPSLSRSPRHVPRVHPLELRPPRPRADPRGDLHVRDLAARGRHRRDRARRDADRLARRRRRARGRRHRARAARTGSPG